ncbi:MAG: 30S ribosome-binding factor RbfA [Acidobacteria bacterium]|nr:30S ribosome-binding factor RbfA [Acidobacteriota bacterium]
MDPRRSGRVAEALREELEELIAYELNDPRIQSTDVVEVLISPDARHACVRLQIVGSAAEQRATLEALEHASRHLRRELANRLGLFRVPELHFEAAIAADLDARARQLLRRIRRGRPRNQAPHGNGGD